MENRRTYSKLRANPFNKKIRRNRKRTIKWLKALKAELLLSKCTQVNVAGYNGYDGEYAGEFMVDGYSETYFTFYTTGACNRMNAAYIENIRWNGV